MSVEFGSFRVPAGTGDPPCPSCGAQNAPRQHTVWRVADERGRHNECDACGHDWIPEAVILGRGYCPSCQIVRTIVRTVGVSEIPCLRCGGLMDLRASGDEV